MKLQCIFYLVNWAWEMLNPHDTVTSNKRLASLSVKQLQTSYFFLFSPFKS